MILLPISVDAVQSSVGFGQRPHHAIIDPQRQRSENQSGNLRKITQISRDTENLKTKQKQKNTLSDQSEVLKNIRNFEIPQEVELI